MSDSDALHLVGARVLDPSLSLDAVRTIVVQSGVIAEISDAGFSATADAAQIDCTGMVLCPGFIDPHVHLREPGELHKETLATGLAAAAAGGFTAVAAMPNTLPPLDDPARVRALIDSAARACGVRCYPIAAVSMGRAGEALAPLRSMATAGAVAFSDDGCCTRSLKTLYHAARLCADMPQPFMSHCDDVSFSGALMHEGELSDYLGVAGSPSLSEAAIAARDLLVAQATGKTLHICHVSAKETLQVLRWAQSLGIRASGEVTPHHLHLTDESLRRFDARYRVNPPLRAREDVSAMRQAVRERTIRIFASDHAPHAEEDKQPPLSHACTGFSGLETAVGATFEALRGVPLDVMVENYSSNVAGLLNVRGGTLAPGSPADITGLYLQRPWTVNAQAFKSKGRNSAFAGLTFQVRPALTIVAGRIVYAPEGMVPPQTTAPAYARGSRAELQAHGAELRGRLHA